MKAFPIAFLITVLAMVVGGCGSQPPTVPQAKFDSEFILKTVLEDGRMVFVGAGGEIDGIINPDLVVQSGETVHIVIMEGKLISKD